MADYGTVSVRVFTARAQIPLEGTTVAVTRKRPNGKHELISIQTANENGKIAPVTIPTPPPAGSEAPGSARPFSTCDVWADHPDYELLVVEDVQVFPGVETVQNMELIPLPEHVAPRDAVNEVLVTPQPL
ncbi:MULTISPECIES: spore cortex-lytic protein [Oscillospiraceae]|uniref:Spore cortex-lytic protein n=1 Tax=Lawsonibacter faecis TaxID=2763052 RepID=A0A8J6J4C8_9FIRM|nr:MULTISPECIES: spore cortex-lytic protein [Oscillospiraceae]MTQ97209.1 spore cortex-lytic protein [Pseudoflavonifractor sp. BIOML-A16]MTR05247.1 spore cortex-lytic protein [Pseudoflavonifractor sp. BIOML-A15]MTR31514.1 spore cortex-lytic protein [Pseudoflavonifractor sp. BIOML-A14]MTR72200.1 spore cortex-lytic protein [Pseudoflavonifractor sp. BIOML-A18]MTS63060.1 spore cortex-lytic protein [Pseudoflavonifractor sp. BIOML-A5]MTS70602.1 spore cortex-lytic protein [Pseudoflavonifractor sp. BI